MKLARLLADLCILIVDCEHKTAPLASDGYPSIRTPNVGRGRLQLDGVNRVDEATYRAWAKRAIPQPNDLIIAREAPVGNVAIIQQHQKVCLGQRTVLVRPDPTKVDPAFLCYYLLGDYAQSRFKAAAIGATVPHLNMKDIRNLPIPSLPSLVIQRRISSILGAYDDLIEVNQRRITLLEEMARRLFEEWFVRFRFPGDEDHTMVETPEGRLPKGWSLTSLGELCQEITDGSHSSPPSVEAGQMMASVKDMRDWDFDLSECRRISTEDFDELVRNGCQPIVGDILIAKDGANLNKHTFLMWREMPLVLLSSIAILRPPLDFEREYLVALLKSDATSAAIKQMKSGAAIPRIVLRDFKRLRILMPPQHLRKQYNDAATPIHELIRRISLANGKLANARDLLLPLLISGEVSVSSAEQRLEAVA
ncbi:restriction endonuclease subunit S [Bradyrhizobium sp. CCBAU 51765]|uniref:restriction endonuclease subunit S n=1 Tax=Bradyrhizobium sp. CCBAU 51765 TaxID=1325102 RepID=UPI001886D5C2|nr:restriction endonuclease subunit S [Bradyrhizobium sp. CCBAU 51765]QOZ07309.1 restriction endonuclease subunit S [Bradyrhizobium sp. CCBAU 51765]